MSGRSWFVSLALFTASCGPDAGVVPRSGVYEVSTETVENDCGPQFASDAQAVADGVLFAGERLTVGYSDFLGVGCVGCVPLASMSYPSIERDAEGEWFVAPPRWSEVEGCRHQTGVVVDVLAEDLLLVHITDEWEDAGACSWLPARPAGCTTVRESTYSLIEACDDCTLDELRTRAQALR